MTDELETKLLKEIEYFAKHPERIGYKVSLVNELKSRLEQHRQTKEWIEGLIEKLKFNTIHSGDEGTNCFIEVVRVDKLLEEISGEGK